VNDKKVHYSGPLDERTFPETLTGRVTTPGPQPHIHGYDAEGDLARHYSMTDLAFLSLAGELPTPPHALAFNVVLMFLAPISVAEAPAHAAVLARICGTAPSAAIGIAAMALGEQARFLLDRHANLLEWFKSPSSELPLAYRSESSDEDAAVERLRVALKPSGLSIASLDLRPTRYAALFAALFEMGIQRRVYLEMVLVWARMPVVLAEYLAEKSVNFLRYPANLPSYRYEESL
jgi:hypothetical protein